ncbi:hypothetical protein D3C78_1738720 [compost metagenome]
MSLIWTNIFKKIGDNHFYMPPQKQTWTVGLTVTPMDSCHYENRFNVICHLNGAFMWISIKSY